VCGSVREAIPIFIGYDPREASAYHVCQQSILDNTKAQVAFYPVCGEMRDGSNTFIYERFLVPFRMGFRGNAIWLDGDMIVRGDIRELWEMAPAGHVGCAVVKHDYKTKHPVKYLGNKNEEYPRKNWSSVVVWNCGFYPNRLLTPLFVAGASGEYLHRFSWLADQQIGGLPQRWNRLVLEQEIQPTDKLLHYTIGTPCFAEYADCDAADEWHQTFKRMVTPIGP
jgi:hypothetical protein